MIDVLDRVIELVKEINQQLPDANCQQCKYRGAYEGGHCYMFQEKPGDKCGQFKIGN